MATETAAIRTYFGKLDLEIEVADIYVALHVHGPQTISELSRSSGVERTHIYRLIDKLLESNLIEVETHNKRGIIKAAPIANLSILIKQKAHELQGLQDELELIEQVLARNSLSSQAVRVQMYQGREGIRQMLRNELRATQGITGYITASLDIESYVGKDFWENWLRDLKKHRITRNLASSDQISMDITHSCSIYSDVVANYYAQGSELYGVETYNKEWAIAQQALLTLLPARHAKTLHS